MFIISHRGNNHDNSFMSIYNSLLFKFHYKQEINWSETDLLWNGQQWMICHDFLQLNNKTISANIFLKYLEKIKSTNWKLILDIKWDYIYNNNHNETKALNELSKLLENLNPNNIWLQFSNLYHINFALKNKILSKFDIGLLMDKIYNVSLKIQFVDLYLNKIMKDEIIYFKQQNPHLKIIGFTCKKIKHLKYYTHLFDILDGLVMDS